MHIKSTYESKILRKMPYISIIYGRVRVRVRFRVRFRVRVRGRVRNRFSVRVKD